MTAFWNGGVGLNADVKLHSGKASRRCVDDPPDYQQLGWVY